ncbi:MAG: DUF2029 domain-containing protein [Anaerolineales bacterium]|nr:MAG: DUF2029 domain-containing protein [Anaerolineales bacterium]
MLGIAVLALLLVLNIYVGPGAQPDNTYPMMHIAGTALRNGLDLYDPAQWDAAHRLFGDGYTDNAVFIYPPPMALLFAPFSLLPAAAGEVAWLLFCQLLLAVSCYWLLRGVDLRQPRRLALIMACVVLFLPTIIAWWQRHPSFLLLFFLSAAYMLLMRRKDWAAGAMLALAALRPSPVLFLAWAIMGWALAHRRWRVWISTAASALALYFISVLVRPGWLQVWLEHTLGRGGTLQANQAQVPTLWGMLADLGAPAWSLIGGVVAVALAIFSVWWMRRYKHTNFTSVVLLFVPLSLFLSPYAWTYDFVLLLIPLLLTLRHAEHSAPELRRRLWPWLLAVMLALPYALHLVAQLRGRETLSALLPLAVWALGLWVVSTPYARDPRGALPPGGVERRRSRKPRTTQAR